MKRSENFKFCQPVNFARLSLNILPRKLRSSHTRTTARDLVSPVVHLRDVAETELDCNYSVTPWFNLTPDTQIIRSSGFDHDAAAMAGVPDALPCYPGVAAAGRTQPLVHIK